MRTLGFVVGALMLTLTACSGKQAGDIVGGTDGGASDGGSEGDGGGDGGSLPPPKVHRPTALACGASKVPAEPDIAGTTFSPNAKLDCKMNEDCTAQSGGRCAIYACGFGGPACEPQGTRCDYDACSSDLDCAGGAVCDCGTGEGGTNRCVMAQCRTDADCGTDGYCSANPGECGAPTSGYYCHSTADLCNSDSDCVGNEHGGTCAYTGNRWECEGVACAAAASN